jgi:preprotein translocase subunit SecA
MFVVSLSPICGKIPPFSLNIFSSYYMGIINNVLSKVVGSHSDRQIKKYARAVADINALEKEMQSLSNEDLSAKTGFFAKSSNKTKKLQAY